MYIVDATYFNQSRASFKETTFVAIGGAAFFHLVFILYTEYDCTHYFALYVLNIYDTIILRYCISFNVKEFY